MGRMTLSSGAFGCGTASGATSVPQAGLGLALVGERTTQVLRNAGARPPDRIDQLYISQVPLAGCTTPHSPELKE